MKKENVKNNRVLKRIFQLFIISLGFSSFYIYIGYSIKPYMFILLLLAGYFIKKGDLKIYDFYNHEKFLLLFFIIASLTVLQFRYSIPVLRYIGGFAFIIFLFLIIRKTSVCLEKEDIEKAISKAGIIIGITSIIYYIMGLVAFNYNFHYNGIQKYGVICDRGIPRLVTLFNSDPNISVFVTSLFFFYYLCNINKKYSKIGLLLTGAMIILTFSRGAYVGIAIPIIIMTFMDKTKKTGKKVMLTLSIVGALLLFNYAMTRFFNISITDTINSRFENVITDNGSGRIVLWKNAIDTFIDHPIFGIGINSTIDYSKPIYGSNHYIHNVYLEVLSETGLVGFIAFMGFIISALKKFNISYKNNKSILYLYVTFISYITQMVFVSVLLTEMMYIMLGISFKYFFDSMSMGELK
jgi:O-antigen ligase